MTSDATVPAQPHIPEAARLTGDEIHDIQEQHAGGALPKRTVMTRGIHAVADAATAKAAGHYEPRIAALEEQVRVLREALQDWLVGVDEQGDGNCCGCNYRSQAETTKAALEATKEDGGESSNT